MKETLEKYSERFDNDESAIGNPETWGKRVLTEEDIFNQRDIDAVTDYIGKETSKQETLEEAANKANGYNVYAKETKAPIFNEGFIAGAKWQQERSYNEEEVIELLQKALTHKDNGETGSLVTAQGKIRTANFYSWFNKLKKK